SAWISSSGRDSTAPSGLTSVGRCMVRASYCGDAGRRVSPYRPNAGRHRGSASGPPSRREEREAFITADGSSIRERAGVPSGNATNQSLAEAVVPPGGETIAHLHRR